MTSISISKRIRLLVFTAGVLGVGTLGVQGSARAQARTTGLQANGSGCVTYTNEFTSNRNELGLYNSSAGNISVECPIIDASDDSYPTWENVKRVELHYRGSAPRCHLEGRDITGAVALSPDLTATTSPLSGLPVLSMTSSWKVGPGGLSTSFILWCFVPPDSWIVGLTAVRNHSRIEGGV